MLNRYFNISERGSSLRREALAGLTTFMAMSYVLFVNPSLLAQAGMDHGAVFVGDLFGRCTRMFANGLAR
ncbi:hypothetical protein ALON55S_01611 [Alishewanella longhuensis]